jgi:BirA family biotin operon repressor/biotin-[acetyl-CoA-carboxylase] ligase
VYASLVLRPGLPAARAPLLTLLAAVAVARGLRGAAAVNAAIKWPNDVVVGRRKIAGILAESRGGDATIRDIVVGIGVNVNQERDDFPEDVRDAATSVRIETGRPAPRAPILASILEGFAGGDARLRRAGPAALLRDWESLAAFPRGGRIVVQGPAGPREGTVAGLDEEGALLLVTGTGATERVAFGEIVRATWP